MTTLPTESGSIQILQVLPFPHPNDAHLDLILAYRLHSSQPYITWVRNRATELPSYSQGHYHADLVHAHHDLVHRYADLVELAYPSESTPNDPEPDPAPSPLPITLSVSEDTRLQIILVATMPYDLHQDPASEYFAICRHGTYEIAAVVTEEFLDRLTDPDAPAALAEPQAGGPVRYRSTNSKKGAPQ